MESICLSVEDLAGGYGKMTILNGVTFKVLEGSITTLIGPNGAGKSTVFRAIFGLLKLQRGRIAFRGRDVTGFTQRQLLAAGICYVPQGRNIFPELSVRANLELGAVAAGKAVKDQTMRLERLLDRFPALRRKAKYQAGTLSGGEQKQLEIARGLLLDPKLLLVDEPSLGLSPPLVKETFALFAELRGQGITILMIEQNARAALQISDYGIVLELGQTRMADSAQKILANPNVGRLFLGGAMTEEPA